jgi:hypothetical protein
MIALIRVPWNAVLAITVFFLACFSTTLECFEMGFMLCRHSVDTLGNSLCECFDLPLSRNRRTDVEDHLLRAVESGMRLGIN